MANGNGLEKLKEDRKAAVEAGLVHYQLVASERDELAKALDAARNEITGLKMSLEVQTAQMNVMESRVNAMQLVRDQAVAERMKYETLFASFQAMLRTFQVPAQPYITGAQDEDHAGGDDVPSRSNEHLFRQVPQLQGSEEGIPRRVPRMED